MKFLNPIRLLLTLVCLLTFFNGTSQAAMQAVGPTDLVTTMPTWYMDTNSLPLAPCIDQGGLCILPPPFDAGAATNPIGTVASGVFPDEAFYYSAFAADPTGIGGVAGKFTIEGGEVVVFGYVLEFAFLSGVVPDTAITFLRTDLQKMRNLTANATYRLTHPYGEFLFQTDAFGVTIDAGPGTRFEDQPGSIANYLPALFKAAPNTNIGPFLTATTGNITTATGTYIGDPALPVLVTGSPTGNNFVRIERLDAAGLPVPGASWQTDYFSIMGKVFTDQIPSPMAIDNASYASDGVNGQLDVFVTALPTASITISGTGIPTTLLTQDTPNTGKFNAYIPYTGTIPTGLTITNSLDVPAIAYPVIPVDEVNIVWANYIATNKTLRIQALSRDLMNPPVTLSVLGFAVAGNPLGNVLDATGKVVFDLSATIPPETVQIVSSQGGTSTATVSIIEALPPIAGFSFVGSAAGTDIGICETVDFNASLLSVQPTPGYAGTLSYAWDFDNDPLTIEATTATVSGISFGGVDGSFPVTLTVGDDFGGSATVTQSVSVVNHAPVALANGSVPFVAYSIIPTGSVTFNGIGTDPDACNVAALTYDWDLDGNGSFETPGQNPTVDYATLALLPGVHNVVLRVTSSGTMSSTDVAQLTVVGLALAPAWIGNGAQNASGQFDVYWGSSITPGASYVLEQSTDAAFAGATVAYSGSASLFL